MHRIITFGGGRIQQYGPRLDKPYPFYDWVPTAIEEITARGETPVDLSVELVASEFAEPSQARIIEHTASDEHRPQCENLSG